MKFFIFFLTFILAIGTYSQRTSLGMYGGVNFSKLNGEAPSKGKYKMLIGATAGINLDVRLSKYLTLSLQASYNQQGTKVQFEPSGYAFFVDSIRLKLNYFSFPLILKVNTPNEIFYAITGFEPSVLINSFSKTESGSLENVTDHTTKWNLSMFFGAGVKIKIGYPRLFLELRYSQGLVNLSDDSVNNSSLIPRVKTSNFSLIFGIEFPFNKKTK